MFVFFEVKKKKLYSSLSESKIEQQRVQKQKNSPTISQNSNFFTVCNALQNSN